MKKKKLTLGLVTSLLSIGALAACNEVTYSDGDILHYTDAQGTVTKITAEEIFGNQRSSGVASTDFDKVYEVLIRNYYTLPKNAQFLSELQALAQKDVQDIKDQAQKNADSNGTTYLEEFTKLLSSNGVDNVNELYQAKLYEEEKKKFESDYETNETIEQMRDGGPVYKGSTTYGVGSDGYLVEQMPYTISHILVKLSEASNGEHAQATITESESSKLGQVMQLLAGQGKDELTRTAFTTIAHNAKLSDDTTSAEKYGQLSVMDRTQADSFVNEFKFGIYAYEALYNQVNQNAELNPYAAAVTTHDNTGEAYQLLSKIKFSADATYTDASKAHAADEAELADGEHYIRNFFSGTTIGRIPYGVAMALARDDVSKNRFTEDGKTSQMSWRVNDGNSAFFPRNILFNKYLNNHRVAVVVPNEIPYNDPSIAHPEGTAGDYTTESFVGVHSDTYAALPGFQTNTKDVLPAAILGQDDNVLTTERGQIVLVVRAGSSGSYEGIHFMVIDRSALVEYASGSEMITAAEYEATKDTEDVNSLQEFYTIYRPGEADFPTYNIGLFGSEDEAKTTYINQLRTSDANYSDNVRTLKDKIKGYNSNKNTYMFQRLIEEGNIKWGTHAIASNVKELIESWIKSQRSKGVIDTRDNFDKTWATYIEYLTAQDQARALNTKGTQRLISETCAIGYNQRKSDKNSGDYAGSEWANGGACYAN